MANKHDTLNSLFTDIADAIREKTGSTEKIVADDFPEVIATIETGAKFASGTKTLSSATTVFSVSGIGFVPKVFMVFPSKMKYVSDEDIYIFEGLVLIDSNTGIYYYKNGFLTYDGWGTGYMSYSLGDTTTITITAAVKGGFGPDTLRWYAIG